MTSDGSMETCHKPHMRSSTGALGGVLPTVLWWETDFYTPPVLAVAALLPFSGPAVCIKIRVLRAQDFYTPLALKTAKGQQLPALEVYKNQSPMWSRTLPY